MIRPTAGRHSRRAGRPAWLSCLAAVPLGILPNTALADEFRLGDLVFSYDAADWAAAPYVDGAVWTLTCLGQDCRRHSSVAPFIYVLTRRDDGSGQCEQVTPYIPRGPASAQPYEVNWTAAGIDFTVLLSDDECDVGTSWMVAACGILSGRMYLLTTDASRNASCNATGKVPAERLEQLLGGLAVAPIGENR